MARRQLILFSTLAFIFGSYALFHSVSAPAQAVRPQAGSKPTFILNLTSGIADLHRSTMALEMARHALDDGREVVIFLNVRASELAKREGQTEHFQEHPAPNQMLKALMARGAQVHVCPMCMKALGLNEQALLEGVVITDRERLFAKFTANSNIFSY
jgi:predicted peroxiredoxin